MRIEEKANNCHATSRRCYSILPQCGRISGLQLQKLLRVLFHHCRLIVYTEQKAAFLFSRARTLLSQCAGNPNTLVARLWHVRAPTSVAVSGIKYIIYRQTDV